MPIYEGNEGLIKLVEAENRKKMSLACGEVYVDQAYASIELQEEEGPLDDNIFHVNEDLEWFVYARKKPTKYFRIPLAGVVVQLTHEDGSTSYLTTDSAGEADWKPQKAGTYDVRMLGLEDPNFHGRKVKVVA